MRYSYYVTYTFSKDGKGGGFGATGIFTDSIIETYDDIIDIRKHIVEDNGFDNAAVMSWVQIKHVEKSVDGMGTGEAIKSS